MTDRYQALEGFIQRLGGAVVAFSGGVDSTLLASAAADALGPRALAVTARSPAYPASESLEAGRLASLVGVRHRFIDTLEIEDARYRANPPDRCYHCKRDLLGRLLEIAAELGLPAVIEGTNADDVSGHRPGALAARELGVRSPYLDLGMGKDEIRALARARGLPNWDRPAMACLASRIPYGEEITTERLGRIERAEASVRALGFASVRVRDHGQLARLEVDPSDIPRALDHSMRGRLSRALREAGFSYASLDLDGYRTGSMDEVI